MTATLFSLVIATEALRLFFPILIYLQYVLLIILTAINIGTYRKYQSQHLIVNSLVISSICSALLFASSTNDIALTGFFAFIKIAVFTLVLIIAFSNAKYIKLNDFIFSLVILATSIFYAFSHLVSTKGLHLGQYTDDWSLKIKLLDLCIIYLLTLRGLSAPQICIYASLFLILSIAYISKLGIIFFGIIFMWYLPKYLKIIGLFISIPILLYLSVDFLSLGVLSYLIESGIESINSRIKLFTAAIDNISLSTIIHGNFGWQVYENYDGHGIRFGSYTHSIIGLLFQFGAVLFFLYMINAGTVLSKSERDWIFITLVVCILIFVRPIFSLLGCFFLFSRKR